MSEYQNSLDCTFREVKNVGCTKRDNCATCGWNPQNVALREKRIKKVQRELEERKAYGEEDGNAQG